MGVAAIIIAGCQPLILGLCLCSADDHMADMEEYTRGMYRLVICSFSVVQLVCIIIFLGAYIGAYRFYSDIRSNSGSFNRFN